MTSKPTEGSRPPSVERVLSEVRRRDGEGERDPGATLAVTRAEIDAERARLASGAEARTIGALADDVMARLDAYAADGPNPVINATGVIVHTNLGRAPWPAEVARGAAALAASYLLLELDRATGRRGARVRTAEEHLIALTGAEDALVTNNNAAAVALAVGLAGRGGVVVSRGELVEIGGGVRIPEIIRRAGARLIEVGTTNRTRASDFEAPLAEGRARAVLRVHPSNFTMAGFTEAPDPAAVAELAHRHGAIVIDDLGSGPCSTPRYMGSRTSPRRQSDWRPARTSSRSAATSSSAVRRRDSSSGGPISSPACAGTRWPARCDRTSSRWPASP